MSSASDPSKTLQEIFGFDTFLPGQQQVIDTVLAGRSALAVFPTGQGKSLCYQLPALHLDGLTLVVSPLMALMKDQVDFLCNKKIAAARLDSSLNFNEINNIYNQLDKGELKLLYVAPERFANERFVGLVSRLDISLMVIDEAHCISEWGHNFRPDYLKLAELATHLKVPAVLALTATATPKVSADICAAFDIKKDDAIQTGFYRPNLKLLFTPADQVAGTLVQQLTDNEPGPTIVYVTLQHTAEKVAGLLAEAGFQARAYHAGLKDELRRDVQDWFMGSDRAIVVATIAFGMGIDKADIRYVYHYNLPKSLENYAQEIGRAGRDGEPADCVLLGNGQDLVTLENFVYGDTPDADMVRACIDHILTQEKFFSVSIYELSQLFDMRPLVVKTLLTYLELEGIVKSTGPFYAEYEFKPLKTSAEILARFDADRQSFLRGLFSCAVKKTTWFSIDLDQAGRKTDSPRKRVITALDYLEQSGDLTLKVAKPRLGFRQLATGGRDIETLKDTLVDRFQKREQSDLQRLQLVVDMVNHNGCKTGFLLEYFGEDLGRDCGHCSFCLQGENRILERMQTDGAIADDVAGKLTGLREKHDEALATARQMSRFLCGLSSPRLTRAKLTRHDLFGACAETPFAMVMEWVKEKYETSEIQP